MTSKFVEVFPRFQRKETPRSRELDELLEKLKQENRSASELAQAYAEWRAVKSDVEGELSHVNLQLEALNLLLIESEEARAAEWGSYGAAQNALRLPNGDKLEAREELSIKAIDWDAIRAWIAEEKLERLLTVHSRTLSSHVSTALLNGDPEPPGVEVTTWKKIVFTPREKK